MFEPLFLTDLLAGLGAGSQIIVALSVGFVAWYLVKTLWIGRMVGDVIGTWIRMGAAVAAFLSVGLAAGWIEGINVGLMVETVETAVGGLWDLIKQHGDSLFRTITGSLGVNG